MTRDTQESIKAARGSAARFTKKAEKEEAAAQLEDIELIEQLMEGFYKEYTDGTILGPLDKVTAIRRQLGAGRTPSPSICSGTHTILFGDEA